MDELTKDECDFVSEERRRVAETGGEGLDGGNGCGKVGRRAQIAEGEHGTVSLEKIKLGVEECLFEFRDRELRVFVRHRRCRVDRSKVAAEDH